MVDPEIIDGMVLYYERLAPRYESKHGKDKPLPDGVVQYWKGVAECFAKHLSGRDVLEIACGPGTWTHQLAHTVRSITATDFNETTLEQARAKSYPEDKVRFVKADAYTLEGIEGKFNGGLANHWFSHIPKSRISRFLDTFHAKLQSGARVVIGDTQLPDGEPPPHFSHTDDEGNTVVLRYIPDDNDPKKRDRQWKVIKNYPTEQELRAHLKDRAKDIEYHIHSTTYKNHRDWCLSYTLL
jgi:ubiquinone/menaquinone biosynthesis C-methylase UbiE